MAKKPNPKPESVLFNVFYEDGSQTSNRRVPGHLIGRLDAEQQIQAFVEQQDEEIARQAGKQRGPIARIAKVERGAGDPCLRVGGKVRPSTPGTRAPFDPGRLLDGEVAPKAATVMKSKAARVPLFRYRRELSQLIKGLSIVLSPT